MYLRKEETKMIKNVDIDQMYAKEKEKKEKKTPIANGVDGIPKPTKLEKLIEEKQARRRIREKSLDIIEACAIATTPETLENDAWQLAHVARTWTDIYTNLNAVDQSEIIGMEDWK